MFFWRGERGKGLDCFDVVCLLGLGCWGGLRGFGEEGGEGLMDGWMDANLSGRNKLLRRRKRCLGR